MKTEHRMRVWPAVLAGFLMSAGLAHALINPNFTPMHLVNQSEIILELQLTGAQDGKIRAEVKEVIKGKYEAKTVSLELQGSAFKEQIDIIAKMATQPGGVQALFFVSQANADGGGDASGGEKGLLHLSGQWVSFDHEKDVWRMESINAKMQATWNGGTDMLRRAVDYVLTDPAPSFPCAEGVSWGTPSKFATFTGMVHAVMPVTLTDGGKQALFVASESGDRLFVYDPKERALQDVTSAYKLATTSRVAAWGALKPDGRLGLVSWDGRSVSAYLQDSNGVLQMSAALSKTELKGNCLSLTVIDSGTPGCPAVLIGTDTMPLLWTPVFGQDAAQTVRPVAAGAPLVKDLGPAGRCLVADFDGSGLPSILQLFAKGSLMYKGKAAGQFEEPKPCAVALGTGPSDAFLGDFSGSGLLDVLTLGDSIRMWGNCGHMKFVDVMSFTGEFAYKGQTDAHAGAVGDINGDGRQDIICFYDNSVPHINFNRGFRSFGHANVIDFDTTGVIPEIANGQQTGNWTNLKGDGIQELVVVLKNGDAWFLPVDTGSDKGGCVRVMLSSKAKYAGPLKVVGWRGKHCLGAWNLLPGVAEGFVAQTEAGPVTIQWQLPNGKLQSRDLTIENMPVDLLIP